MTKSISRNNVTLAVFKNGIIRKKVNKPARTPKTISDLVSKVRDNVGVIVVWNDVPSPQTNELHELWRNLRGPDDMLAKQEGVPAGTVELESYLSAPQAENDIVLLSTLFQNAPGIVVQKNGLPVGGISGGKLRLAQRPFEPFENRLAVEEVLERATG